MEGKRGPHYRRYRTVSPLKPQITTYEHKTGCMQTDHSCEYIDSKPVLQSLAKTGLLICNISEAV